MMMMLLRWYRERIESSISMVAHGSYWLPLRRWVALARGGTDRNASIEIMFTIRFSIPLAVAISYPVGVRRIPIAVVNVNRVAKILDGHVHCGVAIVGVNVHGWARVNGLLFVRNKIATRRT
jgi:hypothetical protein